MNDSISNSKTCRPLLRQCSKRRSRRRRCTPQDGSTTPSHSRLSTPIGSPSHRQLTTASWAMAGCISLHWDLVLAHFQVSRWRSCTSLPPSYIGDGSWTTSYDTQDGLYDIAWSEVHENQIVTASGDGSIRLWDIMLKVGPAAPPRSAHSAHDLARAFRTCPSARGRSTRARCSPSIGPTSRRTCSCRRRGTAP